MKKLKDYFNNLSKYHYYVAASTVATIGMIARGEKELAVFGLLTVACMAWDGARCRDQTENNSNKDKEQLPQNGRKKGANAPNNPP